MAGPDFFSDLNLLAEAQEQAVTGSNPNLESDYDRSDFYDLSEIDEGSTWVRIFGFDPSAIYSESE